MRYATWLRRTGTFGMLGIALTAGSALQADDEKPKDDPAPQAQSATKEETRRDELRYDRLRQAEKALEIVRERLGEPRFRLGVQVEPVDPALNEQLQLEGQGVVVEHVAPEGPAAKANVQAHDIVLTVDDKVVKGPGDLAEIVGKSDGKPLTITAMRAGKKLTFVVTPEKRGESELSIRLKDIPDMGEVEARIREKLRSAGIDNLRLQMFRPGEVTAWRTGPGPLQADFPDDLSVSIRKQGKNPPEIEVKKGDQAWTVKTNELDKLPDDVRKIVAAFIGHGPPPLRASVWASPPRRERPDGPGFGPPDDDGPGDGPRRPRRPGGPPDDDGPDDGPRRPRRPDGPPRPGGPDGPHDGPPGPPRGPEDGPPRGRDGGPPPDRRPGPPREDGAGPRGLGDRPRGEIVLDRLEHQLDEMHHRLDQMRTQLEALRRLPPPRPPIDGGPGDF